MIMQSDIPEEWVAILKRLQTIDPSAVLTGGALRDLEHKKPVKDLDFIVSDTCSLLKVCLEFGQEPDKEKGEVDWNNDGSGEQDRNFGSAICFELEDFDLPINVITCSSGATPIAKCQEHDFGLCQIWWDGKNPIVWTLAYIEDKNRKQFSLRRCNNEIEWQVIKKHYFRLVEKYPEYPLVITPKHAAMITYWETGTIVVRDPQTGDEQEIPF